LLLSNKYSLLFVALGVSSEEWAALTTEDFAKFKAIVIGDTQCRDASKLAFFTGSKAAWAPAVTGNIIAFTTDHIVSMGEGWIQLINNAISFASGGEGTGLYFTTSCLPEGVSTIDALSPFGNFTVSDQTPTNRRNPAHQVASAPALPIIDDNTLWDFSNNVGGVWFSFPNEGPTAWDSVVVSTNKAAPVGVRSFADGSSGFPFVIARGAIPVGCGNGVLDAAFEECDGSAPTAGNGTCTFNCHCKAVGLCPKGATSSSAIPSETGTYVNSTSAAVLATETGKAVTTLSTTYTSAAVPATTTTTPKDTTIIIGVEIILIIDIIEVCPPGSTG
jgi:hypothetical protein